MKSEMRRSLASPSFEEKIAKVGELIRLAKVTRKGETLKSRLDTASAQLDSGEGIPIEKVREKISQWATLPKNSKR